MAEKVYCHCVGNIRNDWACCHIQAAAATPSASTVCISADKQDRQKDFRECIRLPQLFNVHSGFATEELFHKTPCRPCSKWHEIKQLKYVYQRGRYDHSGRIEEQNCYRDTPSSTIDYSESQTACQLVMSGSLSTESIFHASVALCMTSPANT